MIVWEMLTGLLIIVQALLIKGMTSILISVGIIVLFAIISSIYLYYISKNLEIKKY